MRRFLPFLLLLTSFPAWAGQGEVIASIKPLHSLIAGVMDGTGEEPLLLLEGNATPHQYQLKPSQAQALQKAGVVFYIGPELERFLVAPLKSLGSRAEIVAVADEPGIRLLHARRSSAFGGHHHAKDAGEMDMHLWLAPENAARIVLSVAKRLSRLHPEHADRYRANAKAMETRLEELQATLRARLAPYGNRRFIAFHDAYQYFEQSFGLHAAGALSLHPEAGAGARHVADIRREVAENHIACVFREPQFSDALVSGLAGSGVKTGVLDPEGAGIPAGKEQYFMLMEQLAQSFESCLAP